MQISNELNRQGVSLTVSSVKRIQGKALLTLSNGEVLALPRVMLRERPYRAGLPFDQEAFSSFLHERSYSFAMEKAVSMLASRSRTEKEIADALKRNAYPETTIARVMQRLHEAGYINDSSFAEHWIASRSSRGLGSMRIRMELRRKGVDQQKIDDALSNLDSDEILQSAILAAQKAARGKDLSLISDRRKVFAALSRRGFDSSTARTALEHILSEIE